MKNSNEIKQARSRGDSVSPITWIHLRPLSWRRFQGRREVANFRFISIQISDYVNQINQKQRKRKVTPKIVIITLIIK